jgi:hypothetical protein
MSYLMLLLMLGLIGLVTWAIVTYIPMPAGIGKLIVIVSVIVCVLYVLHAFGIHLPNLSVPQIH